MAASRAAADHHNFDLKYRLGELSKAALSEASVVRLAESSRILLLAPHSTNHFRDGKQKSAEFWTGAIAETIANQLDCHVVTAIGPRHEVRDARSTDSFRRVVERVIQSISISTVIDIHGLASRHGLDINVGKFGTREDDAQVKSFVERLEKSFTVAVNAPFGGRSGLSGALRESYPYLSCVQLELGPRLRSDTTDVLELHEIGEALSSSFSS